ncbi:MAG TPA: aa3-type cytochrome c oxidase subunit IV [Caulobacteraceae bacterium]|jgi:predicted anti-sigma-YlaC factor YlaD
MEHALETSTRPEDEIGVHAETYHRFMLGVKWMAIHLAVLLVFLVLWFCTSAGFLTALIAALIVFGAAIYAMTHGLAHSTEQDNPHLPPQPRAIRR